jgi:two-component system, NarL family, nitrate/nitrite response regulator NarL
VERAVTAAIIEDHPVVVEGVTSWIGSDPQRRVRLVHVARDLADLASAPGEAAEVIILDLELGGRLITGEIPALARAGRRIVAFSGHSDPAIVMAVLDAGAYAYVAKDEGRDHLVEAVVAAAGDRPYVTRSQAKAILADTQPSRPALSAQERQALLLWFQGMSKESVGRRMSISENTVRQYINRARTKYEAAGRPAPSKDALLARAIEDQIITPAEVTLYTSRAASQQLPADARPGVMTSGPADGTLKW